MWFSRIRCHFCGSKQPHDRSVTQFQCSSCEALNFLDGKGNIVDTPASVAAPPAQPTANKSFLSFTKPPPDNLQHQQTPTFCRTCLQNQHLYNRILAEYLPDEDHPEYRARLKALPQEKARLEQEYPQICKKCATTAQGVINRADYYALSQNAARIAKATKSRNGQRAYGTRDSPGNWAARNLLRLVELILYAGLAAQIAFHSYGILSTSFEPTVADPEVSSFAFSPTAGECAKQALYLGFDSACYQLFSTMIPRALSLAAICIWFNPGLKDWYHHTLRMEDIKGQSNYFSMQIIILVIRSMAWYTLSDAKYTAKIDKEQIIAMHGFAILFMSVTQLVANRCIEPVIWTMKGKIMPKPTDKDVLGVAAGPAIEHYTPKPSSKDPWRYLRKEDNGPFDINSLAPKIKPITFSPPSYNKIPPSPEFSDYASGDDPDAMELDDRPVMRSGLHLINSRPNLQPSHTYMNHTNAAPLALSDVRNEIHSVEDHMRQRKDQQRLEQQQKLHYEPAQRQSPFYGRLPPAPMSMERRLRNPVLRPAEPAKVPLSQQKDFMAQMRRGVKPVQFPEKGTNFELKKSSWVLPGDVKETGIEDRFTKSFTLSDGSPASGKKGFLGTLFG